MNLVWSSLKVGTAIPDPIATAKAQGTHFSDTTQYNEVVNTDAVDRVRRDFYNANVPKGQQNNQTLGSKNKLDFKNRP
jgi:hypothetical protein